MQLLGLLLYHDGEKPQCFENDQKSRPSDDPLNETFSSNFSSTVDSCNCKSGK